MRRLLSRRRIVLLDSQYHAELNTPTASLCELLLAWLADSRNSATAIEQREEVIPMTNKMM
jgi:hypothetical protein